MGILFFTLFSCNGGKKESPELTLDDCPVIASKTRGLTTLDFSLVKDTFNIPISRLLSDFEFVQLEDKEEALISHPSAFAISDNYIGLSSYPDGYKLFNKKGEFLTTVSSKGGGPDEYWVGVYDSYIDEKNNRIYLLSYRASKLLVFDLEGNPQEHIPFPFHVHKGRFKINVDKKELTMTALPFLDTPSVVWKQDFKGNILQQIDSGPFIVDPGDYSNEINESFNTENTDFSVFLWGTIQDSLYHYNEKENNLSPVFTVKWKSDIIQHIYGELPGFYFCRLIYSPASPDYTPKYPMIIVDKNTLRGCYANFKFDVLGDIDGASWITFIRGYCIVNMFPHELKEQATQALAQPEKLTPEMGEKLKRLSNITENDNNVLLIGKLKDS